MPSISIDNGIMEKAERPARGPGRLRVERRRKLGGDDRASAAPTPPATWSSAARTLIDGKGNVVVAEPGAPYVGVLGVDDLVVVATADAVLVIPKHRAQDVRQLVEAAKQGTDARTCCEQPHLS